MRPAADRGVLQTAIGDDHNASRRPREPITKVAAERRLHPVTLRRRRYEYRQRLSIAWRALIRGEMAALGDRGQPLCAAFLQPRAREMGQSGGAARRIGRARRSICVSGAVPSIEPEIAVRRSLRVVAGGDCN